MDFVSDALFEGPRFHALTVIDNRYVKRSAGRFVGEGPNGDWFLKLDAVETKIAVWRRDDDNSRPGLASGLPDAQQVCFLGSS